VAILDAYLFDGILAKQFINACFEPVNRCRLKLLYVWVCIRDLELILELIINL